MSSDRRHSPRIEILGRLHGHTVAFDVPVTVREISLDGAPPLGLEAASSPADGSTADADAFDRAFERLSVDDRALLVMHYRDDLGLREVAERLDVREGTVKSRLSRARAALQHQLEGEAAE